MGFGKSSRLHTAKILQVSADLPLVNEIVDSEEKIQSFLPVLDQMMGDGLLTLEKVKVIEYRAGPAHEAPEVSGCRLSLTPRFSGVDEQRRH